MIIFSIVSIVITVCIFFLMKRLNHYYPSILTIPLLTSTIIIIILLKTINMPYESYMVGGKVFSWILGPAVVAYAIPLYKNQHIIKMYLIPILFSISIGVIVAISSDILLGLILGYERSILLTTIPKSITLPVAIAISNENGWNTSLTSLWTVSAGLTGLILGPTFLNISNIKHPIARGIGFGCASHVMGATRALQEGEVNGTVASVTMILSAVLTTCLLPLVVSLL